MVMKHRASDKSDQKKVQPKPVCQLKRAPVAPPVYRPQPTPRVLQRKQAPGTSPKPPVAGPAPRVAQPKTIARTVVTSRVITPRPAPGPPAVIQRMQDERPRRNSVNYNF